MLNPELNLNPQIFSDAIKKAALRDGYGEGLLELGAENNDVVALSADLEESTRAEAFAKKYPERFFEVGVAEQGMVSIAAGLGISGKIPFVSSYAVFSPGRNWEQIRTTICYNDSNVKIAGHHAGISTGPDGATHQATEDIALMRSLPNMKVFVPCDTIEAKKATLAAAKIWGPVYLRFARNVSPVITTEATPFIPGKADVFWHPPVGGKKPEVAIIGCGSLIYNCLLAAKELEKEKIGTMVINCHSIKPIDRRTIVAAAKKCGAVVTVEEHQVAAGLGGAVAELLAEECPMPMEFVGLRDTFGESGESDELIKKYGMTSNHIQKAVERILRRK
jgi:transketolase